MASTPATPEKKSWLSKVGSFLGKVLGIVAKDAAPVADTASKVAEAMLPQFSPEIMAADNLIDNIAKQAIVTEGVVQAAGTTTGGGAQKLETVLTNIGPEIDAWVASRFPGATTVSNAAKAGLVNAVVAIMNDLEAPATPVPESTPPAA